jgi:hypothetical protein
MMLLLLILPVMLLSGCGAGNSHVERQARSSGWTRYESSRWGYTVRYPVTWLRASRSLTPSLTDPREILSLGTFPLRYRHTNCEAWAGSAQQDLGAGDAFVTVRETGDLSGADYGTFPARPRRLSAPFGGPLEPSPCPGGHGRLQHVRFSDGGRNFDVLVGFGRKVGNAGRREAYRIVDTLRFDPTTKPDWPASPN